MKKSKFLAISLAFVLISYSILSRAGEITNFVEQSQDKEAYEYVKKTCPRASVAASYFALNTRDAAWDKIKAVKSFGYSAMNPNEMSLDRARLQEEIESRGLSPKINGYLQTLGYYKALQECFPKSEAKRDLYSGLLILSDALGTDFDFAIVIYGAFRSIGPIFRGLSSLNRVVGALSSAALIRLGFSQTLVSKLAGFVLGVTAAEIVPPAVKTVRDFRQRWEAQKKAQRDEFEEQLDKVNALRTQYIDSCFFNVEDPKPDVNETFQKNKVFYSQALRETIGSFEFELSINEKLGLETELKNVMDGTIDCKKIELETHPEYRDFVKP